ncbi:hypothetical protein GCM10011494_07240 [Novosphingobium endophyticum]|uniref:DUF4440 domain-containing protein n=1 Tax=Novosphingobium endophyticum TaxID=1955250 RepID=A0A916TQD0_9SPHN|nr:hypothetical protein [Novosphingobium endophyticum]GGB91404.1 hypothetical protein GCM10011494_07240 [Novosphingobium endophyticum]
MRLAALGLALMALAGALTVPAEAEPRRRPGTGTANPSALVAAEIAFNRLAREKGQWSAFRKTMADSAIMFVPEPVLAKEWLRGRDDPAEPVQWEPYEVWMSCDGTLGVTQGAWTKAGVAGYFTTIWQRQEKGEYGWILDQGVALKEPLEKPLMLSASVADCPGRGAWPGSLPPPERVDRKRNPPRTAGMDGKGSSDDGTLAWAYHVEPDYARTLTVSLRKDGEMKPVLSLKVSAQDAK